MNAGADPVGFVAYRSTKPMLGLTPRMFTRVVRAAQRTALAIAVGLTACSTHIDSKSDPRLPLTSIASLDQARYLGVWYEIAKYPNWFQRKCASDTKAEYSVLPEGGLQVINRCRAKSGETEEATGIARSMGSDHSSQLQVTFAPQWLTFLPLVWAEYWVIDIDSGYQLVAVSEPRRRYLWILARTPVVDEKILSALAERLNKQGFDPERLERTPQSH